MLQIDAIDQYYGGSHILRGISLEVPVGKVTVLLGRNGVGKTTLLRSIMGVVPIRRGAIRLDGQPIHRLPPERRVARGIGYVPQGREIFARPAEVVGTAWDRAVGAPEVSALLARLVSEGRLASRVEPGEDAEDDEPVLHLRRLAPLDTFAEHERKLLEALFFHDRDETDTETVREHYKKDGFDPASIIRTDSATVFSVSMVSVVVIDCTRIGWSPPASRWMWSTRTWPPSGAGCTRIAGSGGCRSRVAGRS